MGIIAFTSADSRYPHLHELLSCCHFGEDWFLVNSELFNPGVSIYKDEREATEEERQRLPILVIEEICKLNKNKRELIQKSILDIDRILHFCDENESSYKDELLQVRMFNMPLVGWEGHRDFLVHLKKRLTETLESSS